jgi:hypothetical protein
MGFQKLLVKGAEQASASAVKQDPWKVRTHGNLKIIIKHVGYMSSHSTHSLSSDRVYKVSWNI